MSKQGQFTEMPSETCEEEKCQFLDTGKGCVVPGGFCVKRCIGGTRHAVGHVLVALGAIEPGWSEIWENV